MKWQIILIVIILALGVVTKSAHADSMLMQARIPAFTSDGTKISVELDINFSAKQGDLQRIALIIRSIAIRYTYEDRYEIIEEAFLDPDLSYFKLIYMTIPDKL